MKKFVGIVSLIALFAIGLYFFTQNNQDKKVEEVVTLKKVPKNIPAIAAKKDIPKKVKKKVRAEQTLSEEEMLNIDKILNELEDKWDIRVKKLFLEELELTEQDFADYMVMREGYEEDRVEAFKKYHNRMAQENGDQYSYSPTNEVLANEEKIVVEYQNFFKKRFGEEAYAKYMNALESVNDQARRKSDPKYGVLKIDF